MFDVGLAFGDMTTRFFYLVWMAVLFPVTSQAGLKDWFKSQEQKDFEVAVALVDHYKQFTIERHHLAAKAQSVEVLKYMWTDSQGNPVKSGSGKEAILVVRYIIRWEGPITKGGMTELVSAYDFKRENVPMVQEKVISTNGIQNKEVAEAAGDLLVFLLKN